MGAPMGTSRKGLSGQEDVGQIQGKQWAVIVMLSFPQLNTEKKFDYEPFVDM